MFFHQSEYNDLAGKLADYVVKLLDKVQGNEELNVLLNNAEGLEHTSNKTLARLQLAIDYKEKKVVWRQASVNYFNYIAYRYSYITR